MDKQNNPQLLELGTHSLSGWSQSLISGGLLAASLGRAAVSVEVGSIAHTAVLVGLLSSFVVMFSHWLLAKSITAVSAPSPQIVFVIVFFVLFCATGQFRFTTLRGSVPGSMATKKFLLKPALVDSKQPKFFVFRTTTVWG